MEELVRLTETGIFQKKSYKDREAYLQDTARMLKERGMVEETFETVIMEREAHYPTGIMTGTIPVSIPHAEFQCVKKESIVITVFEEPVPFYRMDAPDLMIGAEISFMLLLKDADSHLNMLRQLTKLLQSPGLPEIKEAANRMELQRIIREVCAE